MAQAGVPGGVTIATNMAGRGTDIKLGGNLEMRVAIELADVPEGPGARPAHRGHQGGDRGQQAEGAGGRRPVRHRHRAPREPPHRQPAARPVRPPGRPRPLAVLSLARRRPDAHLRLRAAELDADDQRPQGGRGHRPPVDQQGAGEGAAEGRGAELRHPQEPPQVRQRDERPAQGDLRPAHRHHEGRGGFRDHRRHAPQHHRGAGDEAHSAQLLRRAVGCRGPAREAAGGAGPRLPRRRLGEGRRHRRGRDPRARHPRRRTSTMPASARNMARRS